MLSSPPPKNTSNIHLYLEQLLLGDNYEPTEQLLYNKKQQGAACRRSENHENPLGAEGATQDRRNW